MTSTSDDAGNIDITVPNVARMWDYYLGGSNNFDVDREAARLVLGAAPDVPLAALENREFLKHAVRFLTEDAGISQFIDIGPGLPTQGNIHQLARKHDPSSRIVYVDNDPVVLAQGCIQVEDVPGVKLIEGDLRHPDEILNSQELRNLIDFAEPVALCLTLVLHFISDEDNSYAIVARLRDTLCPGSYLVISHVTRENRDHNTLRQITEAYDQATMPLVMRTRDEIARFFAGFTLVEPGLVFLSQWRPSTEYYAGGGTRWAYAGVGKKATNSSA